MGQAFSSQNALVIHTNKPCYYVGETVEGIVALNCINAVTTSGIELEILGYENISYTGDDTSVSNFDDNFDSTLSQRTFTGHSDFFRVAMPLGPPGTLQPGQYQFAFRFTLPEALPQSFAANRKTGQTTVLDLAEVAYKLRAHVAQSGFDIKAETPFRVFMRQPPAGSLPPISNSAERQVTTCCTSQGSTSIQITLDRGVLVAGSSVNVTVQARNGTSKKTFNAINVKLRRRFMITKTPGSVYSRHANDTLATVSAPGLGPGEVAEGPTARVLTLQLMPELPPTAEGRLVQCHYAIEAELHGGLTVGSTTTQVPVRILSCPPYEVPVYQAPPEWKPQVFPTVDVPTPTMPASPQVTFTVPQGGMAGAGSPVI